MKPENANIFCVRTVMLALASIVPLFAIWLSTGASANAFIAIFGFWLVVALLFYECILIPLNVGTPVWVKIEAVRDAESANAFSGRVCDGNQLLEIRSLLLRPNWKIGYVVLVMANERGDVAYPIHPPGIVWFMCDSEKRQKLRELIVSDRS